MQPNWLSRARIWVGIGAGAGQAAVLADAVAREREGEPIRLVEPDDVALVLGRRREAAEVDLQKGLVLGLGEDGLTRALGAVERAELDDHQLLVARGCGAGALSAAIVVTAAEKDAPRRRSR